MPEKPEKDFSTYGAMPAGKQTRKWIDSKARQGQSKALIKHIFSHHIGMKPGEAPSDPCACGYSVQEIIDMMDWSQPSPNAFYYSTAYRDYPRLIKRAPGLNHVAYCRMIAGFKTVPEVLTFFATSGAIMDFGELKSILDERFGGSFWNDKALQTWFFETPKSSRAGMYNRWKKCAFLKPIVDVIDVAETMLG